MSLTIEAEALRPILVAGYGRSGTTAVMNLLGTARQIIFDRDYPYENRYLSYYAKLASILKQDRPSDGQYTPENLYPFEDSLLGPMPWHNHLQKDVDDWFPTFWNQFSCDAKRIQTEGTHYAEKAPVWLIPMLRSWLSCTEIYLFRDPRDVYLSANAFMQARNYYGFHRSASDTNLDHARRLGLEFLNYFENYAWDEKHHPGFHLLRYEDFVRDLTPLVDWLEAKTGIALNSTHASDHFLQHRTSASLTASVARWQQQSVPSDVAGFFERHLGREMKALGYQTNTNSLCASFEFRSGAALPELSDPTQGRMEPVDVAALIHIYDSDFGVLLPFERIQAEDFREVWISVAGTIGDHFSLFWRSADQYFSEERSLHVNYVPGKHWRIVRFQLAQHPLWKNEIEQLRVDLFNSRLPGIQGSGYVRWIRLIS